MGYTPADERGCEDLEQHSGTYFCLAGVLF
jgi:hypothetical protein